MQNKQRTRCEVFSRIVGYLRPVSQWNEGKAAEYKMRTEYSSCDIL
jgi:ribonucleoside-triphosphate reductase